MVRIHAQSPAPDPTLAGAIQAAMETIAVDFAGGASVFKGVLMGSLVVTERLRTVVEIGVHRGRSLVALGVAARSTPGAHAWGIDPYSLAAYPDPTMGGAGPEGVDEYLLQVHDFEAARADATGAIDRLGLGGACSLLVRTAADAAPALPRPVDFLHVDGNHSEEAVRSDLAVYLPLMRPGGVVVIDDISWSSVRAAAEPALAGCEIVFELVDLENRAGLDQANDFRVYRLPGA
jgi:predicted O-methyltransferase YrrM